MQQVEQREQGAQQQKTRRLSGLFASEDLKLVFYLLLSKVALVGAVFASNPKANPIQFLGWWDFDNFQRIAQSGYSRIPLYAFPPLYPAILNVGLLAGVPAWATGFVATNAFSFAFPLVVRRLYGYRVALLVEFFPVYLVYGLIPYSDTISLTFLALAIYYVVREKPYRAAAALSTALVTAYTVAWLLPSFFLLFKNKRDWRGLLRFYLPIALVGAAILCWFYAATGTPWIYFTAEKLGWHSTFVLPQAQWKFLSTYDRGIARSTLAAVATHPKWRFLSLTPSLQPFVFDIVSASYFWLVRNLVFEAFYFACAIVLALRRKWFSSAFTLNVAVPLLFIGGTSIVSIPRHLLAAFPALNAISRVPFVAYAAISVAVAIVILWLQLFTFFG